MVATIPTTEPETFVSGDKVTWTKDLADYTPADGWTLTYYLVTPTDYKSVVATDNGDGTHLAAISPADSAKYQAGTYDYQAVVTKTGEQETIKRGTVVVEQGFAGKEQGVDSRSFAARVLEKIEELIESTAGNDETSFAIDGTSFTFESKAELLTERDRLRHELRAEKLEEKLRNGGREAVRVRF